MQSNLIKTWGKTSLPLSLVNYYVQARKAQNRPFQTQQKINENKYTNGMFSWHVRDSKFFTSSSILSNNPGGRNTSLFGPLKMVPNWVFSGIHPLPSNLSDPSNSWLFSFSVVLVAFWGTALFVVRSLFWKKEWRKLIKILVYFCNK